MRFGVLGPLAVRTEDGRPVPIPEAKVRALLAHLLSHEGRPVPADRLIDDLWGRQLPRNPAGTLQTRVSQLRRALEAAEPGGRELVVRHPPGYVLAIAPDAVDSGRFRAQVAQARATDDPRARAELLSDALALWRGPAYADFADQEFARSAAVRLDEERVTALGEHAQALMDLGEHHTLASDLGDLVSRHPLCERIHAAHLRALYREGRQSEALAAYTQLRARLADELGVDPGPELTTLYEAILRQDPLLRAAARPPSNLPAALTPLIGRADAVNQVRTLLQSGRLLTLTGPGGVGKTGLAVQAARQAVVADGAWLVDFAELDRGCATPEVVAELVSGVVQRVSGQMLLIFDNCEHVVEPVATVTEALLRATPGLRILATSQEPLAIAGERLWPVPPLDTSSAVRLFVERATAAAPDFRLGRDNAEAVATICRRLDGIPLALELAAVRVRTLGVHELAAGLADRFAVLSTGRRGGPARQRTLRATLDWSWELLSPAEQTALRRLAVHEDGFSLAAADGFVDALARLVDRSLVAVTDGPRYRLWESVRAYSLQRRPAMVRDGSPGSVHRAASRTCRSGH
ncbi:MAG: BTAD domain-containing putative transcriptional regulator [Kibdelosporangium sp.]